MKQFSAALIVILCTLSSLHAQDMKIIRLKQQKLVSRLYDFRIAAVKDDRKDSNDIGSVRAGLLSRKMTRLNLPGGAAQGLYDFLRNNLAQDSMKSLPLTMHIVRFEVGEKTGGLSAESEVIMTLSFFSGNNKLIEYNSSSSIRANLDAGKYIEGLIRQNLDTVLYQAEKWFSANSKDILSALKGPAVLLEVKTGTEIADTGMVVYSGNTPLQLSDFRGKPDNYLPASAATYSAIDLKFYSETRFGQVRVSVTVTSLFDKARSWCRPASRNERTLEHEQRHFGITSLKACELVTQLSNYTFSATDYTNEIDRMYRQKQKETEQMQDQYDAETGHGQIVTMQEKWDKMVRELLEKQPCYQH